MAAAGDFFLVHDDRKLLKLGWTWALSRGVGFGILCIIKVKLELKVKGKDDFIGDY